MNKAVNQLRLFLCTCSGEDDSIIRNCSKTIQLRFALIGFFVLLIFFGCFLSATVFTYSLFQGSTLVSIPMGIIWGAVVANIYLLLLYTISPKLLPVAFRNTKGQAVDKEENAKETHFFTPSMLFRLGLMTLLAVIIAQPLNVLVLSKSVESGIEKYKTVQKIKMFIVANKTSIENEIEHYTEFNNKIKYQLNETDSVQVAKQITLLNQKVTKDKEFQLQSTQLLKDLKKIDEPLFLNKKLKIKREKLIETLNQLHEDETESDNLFVTQIESIAINNLRIKNYFDTYKYNLIKTITLKNENSNALNELLNKSNFYIKTIQLLLDENPFSWVLTLIVCLVFILPIIFKYKVRDVSKRLFNVDYKDNSEMQRLRIEIVNTTNFNWLENKIKNIRIEDLRTSDYYFKRMVIEHRIILEEYEKAKKTHSELLTEKVEEYNIQSLKRINPLLEKLQNINSKIYLDLKLEIEKEYKNEVIKKYEYWIDAPFRTKKNSAKNIKNTETDLLQLIYPENQSF